jgi:acyl-CoA dehydrogenase
MDTLLLDTATRIFADHCDKGLLDAAERGEFPELLFSLICENGFQGLATAASELPLRDSFQVMKVAGRFALPLPLPELLLGNRWLARDDQLVAIGIADESGASNVSWGRRADVVLAVNETGVVRLIGELDVNQGRNLAGEPRDQISSDSVENLALEEDAYHLLALSRVMLMSGALERVLEMSLQYVGEREQFGRPISKFQAIQHHMAVMAAEVAAAVRAADAAVEAIDGDRFVMEVAAAKSRVGESVGVVCELAQQVHGAMGFTYEHQLHHFTRRLWAWRDEYGTERYWQRVLGAHVANLGADALWGFIATRS